MSKVKIHGNASGTGIFTVAAPATNTDRTITLPDVDATIMTTAGGTFTSNGWSNTTGGDVKIANSNAVGSALTLLPTASSSYAAGWSLYAGAATADIGDGSIGLWNHTAQAYRFSVDQIGRMRLPYQPAFMQVSLSGYNSVGYLKGTGSNYNLNRGNHYNPTTGRFTAPITGTYIFMCGILVESGTGRLEGYIGISGTQRNSFNGTGTTYDGPTAILVTEMNAGDYALVVRQTGTAHSDGAHPSTYFGGYLLG